MNFVRKFFGKNYDNDLKPYESILLSHTITGYLGEGSMGVVYRVQENTSKEEFALKIIKFQTTYVQLNKIKPSFVLVLNCMIHYSVTGLIH